MILKWFLQWMRELTVNIYTLSYMDPGKASFKSNVKKQPSCYAQISDLAPWFRFCFKKHYAYVTFTTSRTVQTTFGPKEAPSNAWIQSSLCCWINWWIPNTHRWCFFSVPNPFEKKNIIWSSWSLWSWSEMNLALTIPANTITSHYHSLSKQFWRIQTWKNDSGTMSHDTILKWHFTPTRNHKNTMVYRHTISYISCKKSTYATTYAVCFPTTSSPPAYADLRISGFYLRAPFLWPPPFLPHHRGFIAWLICIVSQKWPEWFVGIFQIFLQFGKGLGWRCKKHKFESTT